MSTGSGEIFGNYVLRIFPRHMLQHVLGINSMKQCHAKSVRHDSFLRGIVHMNYQGKNVLEQVEFAQSKVVLTGSQNNTRNTREVLNLFDVFGLE